MASWPRAVHRRDDSQGGRGHPCPFLSSPAPNRRPLMSGRTVSAAGRSGSLLNYTNVYTGLAFVNSQGADATFGIVTNFRQPFPIFRIGERNELSVGPRVAFRANSSDQDDENSLRLRLPGVRTDFARATEAKWSGRSGKYGMTMLRRARFCHPGGVGFGLYGGAARGVFRLRIPTGPSVRRSPRRDGKARCEPACGLSMVCRRRATGRRWRLGRRPPDHARSTTFDF